MLTRIWCMCMRVCLAGKRRGEDVVFPLKINLADLYKSTQKTLKVTRNVICRDCNGKGGKFVQKCRDCRGQGVRIIMRQLGPGMIQQMQAACDACSGKGEVIPKKGACMYLCVYLSRYLCIYVSIYLCMYVSVCVSMYLCICISIYLRMSECVNFWIDAWTCMYVYVSIGGCVCHCISGYRVAAAIKSLHRVFT